MKKYATFNSHNLELSEQQTSLLRSTEENVLENPHFPRHTEWPTFDVIETESGKTRSIKKKPRDFCRELEEIHAWKSVVDFQGKLTLVDIFGNVITDQYEWVQLAYCTAQNGTGGSDKLSFSQKAIESNLLDIVSIAEEERRQAIISSLKFNPTLDPTHSQLKSLAEAITDDEEQSKRAFIILKDILWLVKRKLAKQSANGLESCLYLYSESQATGKSTLINALTKPFSYLTANLSVSDLLSSKGAFDSKLVVKLDEFARFNRDDLNQFKRLVTSTESSERIFYSQHSKTTEIFRLFFITSNVVCQDIVHDSSGNRRFMQILCRDAQFDFDILNSISMEGLYRSIDETLENPLSKEEWTFLNAQKAKEVSRSVEEDFLDENFSEPMSQRTIFITSKQLLSVFNNWVVNPRCRVNSSCTLSDRLMKLMTKNPTKWGIQKHRTNKLKGYIINLNNELDLVGTVFSEPSPILTLVKSEEEVPESLKNVEIIL